MIRSTNSYDDFVRIPGGVVSLNDARRGTQRTVTLEAYEMRAITVTSSEWKAGRLLDLPADGSTLPASGIRWFDAVAWCNHASESAGRRPAYQIGADEVRWYPSADGYRLPTEAEWVFASLGGTTSARYGELAEIAWTASDDVDGSQPVAGKQPNNYGLFDTLGNVWEWCWDRLDPARYGVYRLLKGGGWADPAFSCRVGVRRGNAPDALVEDVGFRLVRGAVAAYPETDGGQGWSEAADQIRASLPPPLPIGWTPLPRK